MKTLAPYVKNNTELEKAALLMGAFKQGGENQVNKYLARLKREGRDFANEKMIPGEGLRMAHNMRMIEEVLKNKIATGDMRDKIKHLPR